METTSASGKKSVTRRRKKRRQSPERTAEKGCKKQRATRSPGEQEGKQRQMRRKMIVRMLMTLQMGRLQNGRIGRRSPVRAGGHVKPTQCVLLSVTKGSFLWLLLSQVC